MDSYFQCCIQGGSMYAPSFLGGGLKLHIEKTYKRSTLSQWIIIEKSLSLRHSSAQIALTAPWNLGAGLEIRWFGY